MGKNHLKRLNAPKSWSIMRKTRKWIVKPKSSHPLKNCMPLGIILREVLKVAATGKEAKTILNQGAVLVNKVIRKEPKFGVGLLDVIEIPSLKKNYRVLLNKQGKLVIHPIDEKENSIRPCKIIGKSIVSGGKTQLSFADGTNIFAEKGDFKAGDTIVFSMPDGKIKEHLKFEKGVLVYMTDGKQVSMFGTVEDIKSFRGAQPDDVAVSINGKVYETRKSYAMVIGKGKPVIALLE